MWPHHLIYKFDFNRLTLINNIYNIYVLVILVPNYKIFN